MLVQCKGSGKQVTAGFNAKRASCPVCSEVKDLTGAGKLRKHTRQVTNRQLRQMK